MKINYDVILTLIFGFCIGIYFMNNLSSSSSIGTTYEPYQDMREFLDNAEDEHKELIKLRDEVNELTNTNKLVIERDRLKQENEDLKNGRFGFIVITILVSLLIIMVLNYFYNKQIAIHLEKLELKYMKKR